MCTRSFAPPIPSSLFLVRMGFCLIGRNCPHPDSAFRRSLLVANQYGETEKLGLITDVLLIAFNAPNTLTSGTFRKVSLFITGRSSSFLGPRPVYVSRYNRLTLATPLAADVKAQGNPMLLAGRAREAALRTRQKTFRSPAEFEQLSSFYASTHSDPRPFGFPVYKTTSLSEMFSRRILRMAGLVDQLPRRIASLAFHSRLYCKGLDTIKLLAKRQTNLIP